MKIREFLEDTITNPIIVKELRATFRGKRFFAVFFGVLLLFTLILIGTILLSSYAGASASSEIGQTVFVGFLAFVFLVSVFVFPAFSCTAIVSERERKTYEMLLVTGIRPSELVFGKFLACMCYVVTFISALLPLVFVCFLFGGVGLKELAAGIFYTLGISSAIVMVSLFVSSLVGSARMAVMVTYGPLIFLAVVTFCPCLCCGSRSLLFLIPSASGPIGLASALLTQFGFLAPTLSSAEAFLLLVIAPASVWALLVSFFFLLTANRLKPSWANRSRPLRILFLAFLAVVTLEGAGGIALGASGMRADQFGAALSYLWLLIGLGSFLALTFTSEGPILPFRLREEYERLAPGRRWLRWLFPGPATGLGIVLAGVLAAGGLTSAILVPAAGRTGAGATTMLFVQAYVLLPLFGAAVLLGGMGVLLGTFRMGETARRWTVYGAGLGLALLPFAALPYYAVTFPGGVFPADYDAVSGASFALSAFDLRRLWLELASPGSAVGGGRWLAHAAAPAVETSLGGLLLLLALSRRGIVRKRITEVARKETTIIRRRRGPARLAPFEPNAPPAGAAPTGKGEGAPPESRDPGSVGPAGSGGGTGGGTGTGTGA